MTGRRDAGPSAAPACLEIPRPWRLARTALASLAESVGLPVAVTLAVRAFAGTDAGIIAGLGVVWLIVIIRKLVSKRVPGLLMIAALMLCVQAALVIATGQVWIYLLQFPLAKLILSVLFARSAATADPLVARLAAEVVAVRHGGAASPVLHRFFQGNTWLWAALFACLAAGFTGLIATLPLATCLLACSGATAGTVCAGAGLSVLWFRRVLRRHELRLTFATADGAAG